MIPCIFLTTIQCSILWCYWKMLIIHLHLQKMVDHEKYLNITQLERVMTTSLVKESEGPKINTVWELKIKKIKIKILLYYEIWWYMVICINRIKSHGKSFLLCQTYRPTKFPKCGPRCRRQLVNPWHQTKIHCKPGKVQSRENITQSDQCSGVFETFRI